MKNRIKVFVTVAVYLCIFILLNMLFQPKYCETLVEGGMLSQYYHQPKDHEVIFLGDCEVYANISPMTIFEETGIKSYVRGTSQQLYWQSYEILKETLKYETPKVIVLSVNALRYDRGSEAISEAYNRLCIDKMRWSKEKYEMIQLSKTSEETIWSYVFPILRYHSRFASLTAEDFKYLFHSKDNTYLGFLVNKNVKAVKNLPTKKILADYHFDAECLHYLDLILELCQDNNMQLMLFKAPSLYPYWYDEYEQQIVQYADEHNLIYLNCLNQQPEIGINWDSDTYDGGLHLNYYGASKLSVYLAHQLTEKYTLTDYRNDPVYEQLLQEYHLAND